jgi:hypothetical protein
MPNGDMVLAWAAANDERMCKQTIKTPFGDVAGCGDLHRRVVSEGEHLGEKV